ncbi:hypothetical protein EsDP_00004599 [Epichloe bromicola]|uniref:Uncharacterized protein n=1 Tax=Epichloe bromicola TaxID=79588 RepID=A0ABQ0CS69_9HYPO
MLLFPASLLVLVSPVIADNQPFPTAIRRQFPDPNQKILAEHLSFAPFLQEGPVLGSPSFLDDQALPSNGTARFYPAFAQHIDEREETVLRRAALALDLLQKRAACPAGMISCADSGSPNKCCQEGTYCTSVPDTDLWAEAAAYLDMFVKELGVSQVLPQLLLSRFRQHNPTKR